MSAELIAHVPGVPSLALHEAEVRLTQPPTSPSHGGQQNSSYSQLSGSAVEVAQSLLAVGSTSGQREIGHGPHRTSAEATRLGHVPGNPGTPNGSALHETNVVLKQRSASPSHVQQNSSYPQSPGSTVEIVPSTAVESVPQPLPPVGWTSGQES